MDVCLVLVSVAQVTELGCPVGPGRCVRDEGCGGGVERPYRGHIAAISRLDAQSASVNNEPGNQPIPGHDS